MRMRRAVMLLGIALSGCAVGLVGCVPAEPREQLDGVTTPSVPAGQEVSLPDPATGGGPPLADAIRERRSVRSYEPGPITLEQLSQLLWATQGITDERREFRTAPSAGATYPLEVFVIAGEVEGLGPGVYRYAPREHLLTLVLEGDVRTEMARAALGQGFVAEAPLTVLIAAVYERTERRYGQRGQRYVYMEVGHAAQNLHLQAVALGLGSVPVGAFNDAQVGEIAGLGDDEAPLYLIPVGRR
ncbi:MAG TPA: SagB/ThcOx family dehydrogenase [Coriobacteriia bacterium]|nr:SagB/ThcOx family dehydrogenase [Coriobacteriia bacterium]